MQSSIRILFIVPIFSILFVVKNSCAMENSTNLKRDQNLIILLNKIEEVLKTIEDEAKHLEIDKDFTDYFDFYKTELSQIKKYSETGDILPGAVINKSELIQLNKSVIMDFKYKIRAKFPEFLMSQQ